MKSNLQCGSYNYVNNSLLENGIFVGDLINRLDIKTISSLLSDYKKIYSICCLAYAGLPVLPTLIFTKINTSVQEKIKHMSGLYSNNNFLVRSQTYNTTYGKSFMSIPIHKISKVINDMFDEGSSIIALHPAQNIHRNYYSMNIDFGYFDIFNKFRILIEVVGPGFIASNLNRHGMLHEIIYMTPYGSASDLMSYKRHWQISSDKYIEQVQKIIEKYNIDTLIKNESLLLKNSVKYIPINELLIKNIHNSIDIMRKAIEYYSENGDNSVIYYESYK